MYNKKQDFYIKCKVCNYSFVETSNIFKSKYVEYTILITCTFKGWQINKRYSDFEKLNKNLSKRLNKLPELPLKKIDSLSLEVIKERMSGFEKYLNNLLFNYNILQLPDLGQFLELNLDLVKVHIESENAKEIGMMKRNKSSMSSAYGNTACNSKENIYINLFQFKQFDYDTEKTANSAVIEQFLRNLDDRRDKKTDIIKEFEDFLKDSPKWPYFSFNEIYGLFNGINEKKNRGFTNGLLFHIGNVQNNNLGSQKCLEFLYQLLNYEFNPQSEDYFIGLRRTPVEKIIAMELEEHILSKMPSVRFNAFCVLNVFLNKSRNFVMKCKRILNNETAEYLFIEWHDKGSDESCTNMF